MKLQEVQIRTFNSQEQFIEYVKEFVDEVDMELEPEQYEWRYEPAYPLKSFGAKKGWIQWFNNENREGNGYYSDLLYEEFNDPIVVGEIPPKARVVFDGNHRVGAAMKRGDMHIAAIVGVPK